MRTIWQCFRLASAVALGTSVLLCANGCVSKSKAEAHARAAYAAGQQDALHHMQRNETQAGAVTLRGMVRQAVLPWTPNMTVASALLAADYFGPEPSSIIVARAGRAMTLTAAELLSGKDIQLQSGDVVEIRTEGAAPSEVPPR